MQFLIKKGIHDPVAMYFRNDSMQKYEECPDNVLDLYHRRNSNEGINSYLKDHLEFEACEWEGYKKYRSSRDGMLYCYAGGSSGEIAA